MPDPSDSRAGRNIETPVEERSFRVPYAWFWPGVGAALVLAASIVTAFVFVTKGEFHEHQDTEKQELVSHAAVEAKVAADLATQAALHGKELEQHDKMIGRVLDYLEAVNANQATMLREVSVPERRIAKPKEQP